MARCDSGRSLLLATAIKPSRRAAGSALLNASTMGFNGSVAGATVVTGAAAGVTAAGVSATAAGGVTVVGTTAAAGMGVSAGAIAG